MNNTTLYVILGVALGLLVGFVLVMYLLQPSLPTVSVEKHDTAMSRVAGAPLPGNLN